MIIVLSKNYLFVLEYNQDKRLIHTMDIHDDNRSRLGLVLEQRQVILDSDNSENIQAHLFARILF
jgi:hypothetical protein